MEALAELSQFFELGTRPDVLRAAVSIIVNLSASIQSTGDAVALFGSNCCSELITRLLSLLQSELIDCVSLKIDILRILINATSFAVSIADEFSAKLFAPSTLPRLCSFVATPFVKPVPEAVSETKNRSEAVNLCNDACLLLSNLTREKRNAEAFFDALSAYCGEDSRKAVVGEEHSVTVSAFLLALAKAFAESEQGKSAGFLLRNLTQLKAVREALLCVTWDKESEAIGKRKRTLLLEAVLKPLWTVSSSGQATGWDSDARRIVAADILRNCCMDFGLHDAISKVEQLLMYFLWCLAGPEELTDDENECLPLELQCLEQTKAREPNVKLRIALLEALYQAAVFSVIYADFERFIWRRLYLIDGPQLPREIGCVWMLEVPATSIFSSDDTSAAAQQAASNPSTLFCIVAKDYQTDTVCIQLYSSSSQRKCQLLPAARSTSTSTSSCSSDFETSAVCIRSSSGPADAFPGDIMEPLTLAADFNSNLLVFLYKSQFAAIDRLARFHIASNVWQDSLVLTSPGLNSRLPSSHDSGVVALSLSETNRNGEFDCNDQMLFLCTVEIQRPLWRLKIWALDLQTQTMCVFAHMDLEQFYAEQRIHLSVTPDGCLLVALRFYLIRTTQNPFMCSAWILRRK